MATYAQLKKQIEQLAKKAEAALRAEKDEVLAKVRDAVSSFSLTAEEVFGTKTKKAKNAKAATVRRVPKGAGQAKYADPKTGATWSGFGRAPAWIASAKDRTKLLVNQPAAAAPSKSKAVKPATKPKAAKAPATKKAVKAPPVAPAKKSAKAVATVPAKKGASKAKAASPAKKATAAAPKKAVSKTAAPTKKLVAPKVKTKMSVPAATAIAAAPAATAQA